MGGTTFMVSASGKTANEAFRNAREDALYESGHGGYTGTIAEKGSFVNINYTEATMLYPLSIAVWRNLMKAAFFLVKYLFHLPAGTELTEKNACEFADKLIHEGDRRIDDKWGPAGCIFLGNDRYLFFGWASC